MAVVGLGVMGGSLVRALAARGDVEVSGWSPEVEERRAAASLLARAPEALEDVWEGADLVVLATPLEAILELLPHASAGAPEAVLTDVASLRAPVEATVRRLGIGSRHVGSHPMAGSEASGFAAASDDLYQDAPVWVVEEHALEGPRQDVRALWTSVGAQPRRISSEAHDALMARVSHLPQLASTALAAALEEAGVDPSALGPGGRDMTRLAESSPAMWRDLLRHAPEDLPELLRRFARQVEGLADEVASGRADRIADRMAATRRWRRKESS